MVVIPNTLELTTLWVSRPLEDEVRAHPHLTRETEYQPMPIGDDGELDLVGLFPESQRAPACRRSTGTGREVISGALHGTDPPRADPPADSPAYWPSGR